jgi:hypothetical protein
MSTQLTNHLKQCSETDTIFQPLFAQWSFDEHLAAKALQNVGTWFPHYSRHDASHARQILIHIERLLGDENITKLSATDTWLILEASYFHDIGMIVPFDHAVKDLDSAEFHRHLENARSHSRGDEKRMIDALIAIPKEKRTGNFLDIGFAPLYAIQLLREIIADYYRAKHPDRSALIVSDPKEVGINSPRTELIPARLFSLLGKICSHHGKSFEDVMLLPYRQVGMGRDDCHPRFVACLLRLGDLLDLDDNRFCPVMLRMAGVIPESSKAHIDKHTSIRHFRADRERIEIEAECESYDGYVATNQWFTWLREEIQRQMGRWFDIVPARDYGLLPSVGDLKIQLKDYKIYSENERPRFEIDSERIFGLLQGSGLYERKEQAMRELLQNAVDATLIRAWMEHGDYRKVLSEIVIRHDDQPRADHIVEILKKYPIHIEIHKEKEDENYNYWSIEIRDQGVGISEEDLRYMARIGASEKNKKRRGIIESMPIWMRPSGIFGIGLQSAFLLTNEVQIETRNIDAGQALSVRLTDPEGAEKGNVYIRYGEKWDINTFGTSICFVYKSNKKSWSISHKDRYAIDALRNSDLLFDDCNDVNILKICDEIRNFFDISLISGRLNLAEFSIRDLFNQSASQNWCYFSRDNLELANVQISNSGYIDIFYRGQYVNDHLNAFNFISASVNLLDERADQILSINRNKIRREKEEELRQRVYSALQEFFKSKVGNDYLINFEMQKPLLAAEYELQKWEKPNFDGIEWNQAIIIAGSERNIRVPINKLDDYDSILYVQDNRSSPPQVLLDNEQQVIIYSNLYFNEKLYPLISKFLRGKLYITYREQSMERQIVVFGKGEKPPISLEQMRIYCNRLCNKRLRSRTSYLYPFRETIPCLSEYEMLALGSRQYFGKAFPLD